MKNEITVKLTPRTRIEYRITTAPADFGYDGQKTNWLSYPPAVVGTPLTILRRAAQEKQKYGEGVYHAEQYRTAAGCIITRDEIKNYEMEVEYRAMNK